MRIRIGDISPRVVAWSLVAGVVTLVLIALVGLNGSLLARAAPSSSLAPGSISIASAPPFSPPGATGGPTSSTLPAPMGTPLTGRGVALGAFIPGAASDPSKIDAFAALVGATPNVVMWYQTWAPPWNAFNPKTANAIRARGAMPIITWEPRATHETVDRAWSLSMIINGTYDSYIHHWARAVAAWGHPIYVRPMHEMNAPWYSWSAGVNGNTAAEYVPAWKHIVDIARAEGATNIRWVWCPNVDNGDPRYAPYASLYPGDAYVDWVGLGGYNWGTSQTWSSWQSLYSVFKGSLDKIRALTAKPLMISETSSAEVGGDKAAWITTGFASLLANLPQVRAVIWFDTYDSILAMDWRVDSSTKSLAAFRAVAASDAFDGTLP